MAKPNKPKPGKPKPIKVNLPKSGKEVAKRLFIGSSTVNGRKVMEGGVGGIKKAALTAAQRAAKSKATREQAKNRIKKLDKPLVGKAQRRAVGKTTNKYAQYAIKNQMKNPEFKDIMYANKKSGRPTSWSKTRSLTNAPMGALRKGKKPTPYQVSQLNKMKNARKPK
jgi:hypothetical protein